MRILSILLRPNLPLSEAAKLTLLCAVVSVSCFMVPVDADPSGMLAFISLCFVVMAFFGIISVFEALYA